MNSLLEKGGKSLLLFISSTYDVSTDARVARSYIGKNQVNYFFDFKPPPNAIYIHALGGGFKCLRKIHLNTQCPLPLVELGLMICQKKIGGNPYVPRSSGMPCMCVLCLGL